MRSKALDLGVLALAFVWTGLLLAAALITQKGFFTVEAKALLALGWAIAGAALWWASALGVGMALTRSLPADATDRWVASALVGAGTLGLAWLLVGLVRVPPAWLTPFLLAAPLYFLWRERPPLPRLPSLHPLVTFWLVTTLTISFLSALQPTNSFDSLLYHLRLPEIWARTGTVLTESRTPPYYFPVLVEAQVLPALQLAGERSAALVAWGFFPLLLALLARLTRRFLPSASLNLTLLLAGSIQMVPLVSAWLYTDLTLASYQMGALWALLHWRESRARGWLIVAGAFAGMALNVKYLAFLTPLLLALLVLLVARRAALRPLLLLTLVTTVVALPSYLRNALGTGNPLFPFALPSAYWDAFRADWYAAAGTGAPPAALLGSPLLLVLGIRDLSYFDARPGPLVFGLLPLALWFLFRRAGDGSERRVVSVLVGAAALYFAFWLVGAARAATLWQGRFLITLLLLLCPAIAWGAARFVEMKSERLDPAGLIRLVVALWAAAALLIQGAEWAQSDPVAALLYSPRAWRTQKVIGSYQALTDAMAELPADSRTVLLMEPRSYLMPPATEPDTILYAFPWRLQRANGDPTQLTAALCTEGFTHAVISWRGVQAMATLAHNATPLSAEQVATLRTWRNGQKVIWQGRDQRGTLDHQLLELTCP